MANKKSIYDRLALKQKVGILKKTEALTTLQQELARTSSIRDQLIAIIDDTAIVPGETTGMHLRSASWYGGQIQDQLVTITNRTEFLDEEVDSHRRQIAGENHRYNLSLEKGVEHNRKLAEEREDRHEAMLPPRPNR